MKRSIALVLSLLLVVTAFAAVQAAGSWEAKVDASVLRAASQGTTDFIVYMAPKADLSAPSRMPTKAEKGTAVYNALTAEARITQAGVISVLEDAEASYRSFWITNAIHTRGDAALIQELASRPDVANIFATGKGQLDEPVTRGPASTSAPSSTNLVEAVGPSVDFVNANDAWSLGYRGQGAVVASADTGVRWTHNAIKRQYRGFNETTGTAVHDYNWHDAFAGANADCVGNATAPCDDHDHGTHTVGTMVGDDGGVNQIGMAPDAEWIACRNMNQGFGVVPSYLDCMEWFIAPTDSTGANPDPTKAPDVVNNSWGCVEVCAGPILKDVIDASRAAGIFYAVSAGNDNQFFLGLTMACNTINFPLAIYKSAFTVGALDANGAGVPSDGIADYSSLGPVDTNPAEGVSYRKPDITAPGTNVRSSVHGSDSSYAAFSGTSMAGPHVAGLVALIISANPALRGHVDTIEDIIEQTAKPLTSNRGCGLDSNSQVPNNEFGWGRINALAAVQLAVLTGAPVNEPATVGGEPLDPAHNLALPCEAVSTVGALPRSAKNLLHVANVCGIVGTDIEFQSRRDSTGAVHDYAFLGTMGAGTRIFDVTDPHLPRFVGGYVDPGWQNDVQVFGDTLIMAFDPVGVAVHTSDCLRQMGTGTNGQVRGGVDFVQLTFDPALAALKAPLTFQTSRKGCYLTELGGGAHTITIHPSGEWLSLNTSSSGIEVVDLRNDAFKFVRKIPSAIAASAHDISFSRDGNTMYIAGVGSTRIVDVSDIFNRNPTLIANIANTPPADQADGHQVAISHQSDTTADGRLLVITDEKGGGLSHTACITSPTGTIGGANFYALTELAENPAKSAGASVATPRKVGTWIYPRATAGVDPLDDVMAGFGRPEPSCTIHVFRLGGNGGQSPAGAGQGNDGYDGVSRLPTSELVSAHYGAGVWHVDVMSAPGPDDDSRTTWGRTLGWNIMPGADTWSAKEYKGYIYAGDMARGFDIYTFGTCAGVECVDALPDATPTPNPTATVAPTPTSNPTPTATPTDPSGCTPSHVYFLGVVNDGNEPGEPRVDFQADMSNFEYFLSKLRQTYCIPDSQAQILAFTDGWVDAQGNPMSPYPEASEFNVKREIARLGAAANQHSDSVFFFFLSSHGIAYANAISECPIDRVAGSLSGLKSGNGESGDFYDCELGSALNTSFAPTTRMFVDVDCSLCGGFSDSLTAVSGTVPDGGVPTSAGVVGANRIVVTGCAMTTECFGSEVPEDGGVSYHHMREVLEGGIPACDGWTAPGFPDIEGFDLPVQGPPLREYDGKCTASEWFFGAVNSAYVSLDVIAIQQQFRIKYRMPTLADDLLILGSNDPAPTPTATVAPTPTATIAATPTPTLAPTPTPTIAPRPDLSVSAMSASEQKAKAGDRVVINATIANTGNGGAASSRTEFRFADGTLLGAVDAPSISAGGSVVVSVTWDTRGANGDYVITASADVNNLNAESNESNNTANLSVSIRGNKVQNQSYEQPNSSGTAPEGWQGQSTGAGSTSYNQNSSNSSDGSDSVSITGNGKSALLYGAPTWTSSAFTVIPGELLTVAVDVKSVGLSSAPSLSLAYLGSAGQLLNTVKVLTAPLTTTGFATLQTQVSVPLNVTSVKLVLSGFAATDTGTAGAVTFDNVGAWSE